MTGGKEWTDNGTGTALCVRWHLSVVILSDNESCLNI